MGRAPMNQRRTAVPRPAATNRRPVTITRSRTRFPRYAPITNKSTKVMTIAAIVASRKSRNANGMIGRSAARSGATPWTSALRIAANWNASLCSSLSRASIARSIVRMSSFFSTRSASYAPTAYAPMMIPRTVRAPSNAPITKYRRMIGPTFVISSYSRIRRRQAPTSMSSARGPKFLANGPFESFRGRPRLIDVREARLGEVGFPAAFPSELRRDGLEDLGDVDRDARASRHDQADIRWCLRPQDGGRFRLGRDCLRHGHHEADAFRHFLFHERPRRARRLDRFPGLHHGLFVRRALGKLPQLLPLRDDSFGGRNELVRRHAKHFGRPLDFLGLFPDRLERRFSRRVFEAHDAVLDSGGPEDLDERDIARPRDMRSAAGLHVPLRNLDDAQLAAGHRAALVEPESELPFREIAGQDLGAHLSRRQDLVVGQLFDLQQLRVRQRIEVRDVESRHVDGLVGPRLPDMISECLARGAQDDVGGRVVSHEGLPSIRIDRAGHPLSPKTTRVAPDEVQDGRSGSLNIVDFEFVDRPVVGFLTTALRVEERLIEDDGLAFDRDDLRAERTPAAVFVHAKFRRRKFLLDRESLLGLRNRTLVSRRHASVEVIRDLDRQVREFLDDVRIESVAVVELQERFDVESLAGGRELSGDLPDGRTHLLARLLVTGLLDLEQFQDVPLVEEELRIILPDPIDHEGDRVGQAVRDVQVLERPESAPYQETGEVTLPAVRRHDAVSKEEDQRARMVAHRVQGLEGRDLRNEFVDRDPDAVRRPLANLADVRQRLDLEHARDFRIFSVVAVVFK